MKNRSEKPNFRYFDKTQQNHFLEIYKSKQRFYLNKIWLDTCANIG